VKRRDKTALTCTSTDLVYLTVVPRAVLITSLACQQRVPREKEIKSTSTTMPSEAEIPHESYKAMHTITVSKLKG